MMMRALLAGTLLICAPPAPAQPGQPAPPPSVSAPGGLAVGGNITGGTFNLPGLSAEDRARQERQHAELMAAIAQRNGIDPQVLRPIFEHLGQRNLTLERMRADAEKAVAAILDRARQPPPTDLGADIEAAIADARAKLRRLDTPAALAGLNAKLAEEEARIAASRRRREVPLLREKAAIQRLTYDHAGAKATLRQLLALDRDGPWNWIALGDAIVTTGGLAEARTAFEEALAAARRADPQGRDVAAADDRLGNVLVAQGDRAGALAAYRASLAIRDRLAAADPGNAEWQRDLSVSHNKLGDVLVAQGERAGALAAYRASLAIAERLAAADPGNAEWQRDLMVSCVKLAQAEPERVRDWLGRALGIARALAESGRLAPVDARIPGAIERRLRQAGD